MSEAFTTKDGRRLSYERRGAGPLLVCHPGGPGGSAAEFRDFAGLDDTFALVLLSPRGAAGSDPAADGYALSSYASDLDELRVHLGVERMNLLGFSHGGIVAMVYAATYPERIDRLVLASTIALFDEGAQAAQTAAIEGRRGEPWFPDAERALMDEQSGAFETSDELVANVQEQIPLYFHRWEGHEQAGRELAADFAQAEPLQHFNEHEFPGLDLRPELRRIAAPTLVVAGESDFICGPVCARAIAGELADVRLVVVPGAGHFTYVERPDSFRGALTGFLGPA